MKRTVSLMNAARSTTLRNRRKTNSSPRVQIGQCTSKHPIAARKYWKWLPRWLVLSSRRGKAHMCWEGHRLKWDKHDGRVHTPCACCDHVSAKGASVLACRPCRWTFCAGCSARPRLPALQDDPLFHGPDTPRLLPPPCLERAGTEPDDSFGNGTVIICPGGNYEFLVASEGMPAAELLTSHGIRAFVLRYRLLPNYDLNDMLEDFASAVSLVRSKYGGPVAAMGFSAGGHLMASHAIRAHVECQVDEAGLHAPKDSTTAASTACIPLDAQVLIYPAIDPIEWTHPRLCGFWDWENCFQVAQESLLAGREALLGGQGFHAPPTFMVASTVDEASPPKQHTDRYAQALRRHSIPHVYLRRDFGAHGFGIEGGWTNSCVEWLREKGFGVNRKPESDRLPLCDVAASAGA